MNYAEDRLDRRARFIDCSQQEGLWSDFTSSLSVIRKTTTTHRYDDGVFETDRNDTDIVDQANAHERLSRCLRDIGWNRHAVYHFAAAWMLDPSSSQRAGDYAQMAELAGFPEVGALALLFYFHHQRQHRQVALKAPHVRLHQDFCHEIIQLDPTWLQQSTPPVGQNCGCGLNDCATSSPCFLPMKMDELNPVVKALEDFLLYGYHDEKTAAQEDSNNSTVPSANTILGIMSKNALKRRPPLPLVPKHTNVPESLLFWKLEKVANPVLQLLLLKLLYQVLPTLAATAVVELQEQMDPLQSMLAASHKSHWAYYVLIRAVVLGERIKPHRRWTLPAYHIPVWDVLWDTDVPTPQSHGSGGSRLHLTTQSTTPAGKSQNHDSCEETLDQYNPQGWPQQLRQVLHLVSTKTDDDRPTLPGTPLSWTLAPSKRRPHQFKPLFVIGDSHVLSLAWQTLTLVAPRDGCSTKALQHRRLVPIIVTGLKAFHIRAGIHFFTNSNLHTSLQRLQRYHDVLKQSACTVLFSAGEIDCREGIGGQELLEGYRRENLIQLRSLIEHNVQEYIVALEHLRQMYPSLQQILVLPVPPHAQRNGGKKVGRAVRREITHMWNEALRQHLLTVTTRGLYLMDYEPLLRQTEASSPVGYVLNPCYNADHTHLNAAVVPLLQKAIQECGCDWNLL